MLATCQDMYVTVAGSPSRAESGKGRRARASPPACMPLLVSSKRAKREAVPEHLLLSAQRARQTLPAAYEEEPTRWSRVFVVFVDTGNFDDRLRQYAKTHKLDPTVAP
jgi:hypothetical protein